MPKKQRDGNGRTRGWQEWKGRGLRPASELILGRLSSLVCDLADMLHWGLDSKYPGLALHHRKFLAD